MKNIKIFLVFLFVFQSSFIYAKTFIWKINGKNNTVYLAGSIHLLKKSDHPLSATYSNAYKDSKELVFEADIDEMKSASLQLKTLNMAMFTDGKKLRDVISKDLYKKTTDLIREKDILLPGIDIMKPWFLSMSIPLMYFVKQGYLTETGVDYHFYQKASDDRKEISFLESCEFQLNALAGNSIQEQIKMLEITISDFDKQVNTMPKMINAWKKGDSNTINNITIEMFKDLKNYQENLLYKRNRNWVTKIEALLKKKHNVMVIVGAAHIPGKKGLIDLLQKRGYKAGQM